MGLGYGRRAPGDAATAAGRPARLGGGGGGAVGVTLGVVGLRLGLDAEDQTALLARLRPEFAVPAIRWAAVAAVAAAQAGVMIGVVWVTQRRGLVDTLYAAVTVALLAGFAAVVLAVSGR